MEEEIIPQEIENLLKRLAKYNNVYSYESEDLEQEFRMIYFSCLKNFDKNKDVKFETYFTTACLNRVNRLRKKYKDNPLSLDKDDLADYVLDERYDYDVLSNEVLNFIEKLPYGEYAKMYFFQNIKQADIAKHFGVSPIWVNLKIKEIKETIKQNFS